MKDNWHKVASLNELPEGRITNIIIGTKSFVLTHNEGKYGLLDNACPHQGGPLSEGSIEKGHLRCPWHGWGFCPHSGKSPEGHGGGVRSYPVEVRTDGIYVQVNIEKDSKATVSDLMVQTMINWGIDTVFGMVGHSNLGFADAMRKQEEKGHLKYIGVRHEGAAAFACSGYAKTVKKPAACFSIAGPGATNLLTGLWDAHVDRAPVLALTGQVNTQYLGPGAFQEIDLHSAFSAVSSFSQTVLRDSNHSELMGLAIKNAIIKEGVGHLILPDESQGIELKNPSVIAPGPDGRMGDLKIRPPEGSIDQACIHLKNSQKPVIVVGYGARESMESIISLAEKLEAPIITTFKAKGLISDHNSLASGVLGRSGTPIASWLMKESDLLLVFGASFSNHTGITPRKDIIQIDRDPMALGKFHAVKLPIQGDCDEVAKALLTKVLAKKTDFKKELRERWSLWRKEKISRSKDNNGKGLNAASIFAALEKQIPEDAIIPVDVGNNTYSFGRYFEVQGQTILMSGYLGSIGFAFPAGMGAWAACRGSKKIVSISGDGGFAQYMPEFMTAVKYNMNITHIVLNNSELGKISKEQISGEFEVWQTSLHNLNFSEYAIACGGMGLRVTKISLLEAALKKAFEFEGPSLVEIISDPTLI